jgi:hypothetical protein
VASTKQTRASVLPFQRRRNWKTTTTKQNKILRFHDSRQIPICVVHLPITQICVTKNVIRHKVTFDPSSSRSLQSKKSSTPCPFLAHFPGAPPRACCRAAHVKPPCSLARDGKLPSVVHRWLTKRCQFILHNPFFVPLLCVGLTCHVRRLDLYTTCVVDD